MKNTNEQSDSIDAWRGQLDIIDDQIIELLARRMTFIDKIGKYKKENNIIPFDPKRWKHVIEKRLIKAKQHGLSENMMRDIYETIHQHALLYEKKL